MQAPPTSNEGRPRLRARVVVFLLAALALPAAAHAGPRVDYRQTFTTKVPGAPTGTDTQLLYKHPADRSAKPIPVRREVFIFPKGTRFDGSVVPDCAASDLELLLLGETACPARTRAGAGRGTVMTGFPDAGETPVEFDMFDLPAGFVVVGGPPNFPLRQVTRPRRRGRVVTVEVPRPPGGPPEGESVLRRVHNVFPPHSRGRRTYVRTPRTCPRSGVWIFRARFTFADGVVEKDVYEMPCRRRRHG